MECIILCGGLGTRIRPALKNLPKALAPIKEKPFLFYLFEQMKHCTKIVLAIGHQGEQIKEMCRDFPVEFSMEKSPLDTGGALKLALEKIEGDTFFAMNGDVFLDCNFDAMMTLHLAHRSKITLAAAHVAEVKDYGQLELEEDRVKSFIEKGSKTGSGWINGGIYLMQRSVLNGFEGKFSLEKDVFPNQDVYAYKTDAEFIDIGTPDKYSHAQGVL